LNNDSKRIIDFTNLFYRPEQEAREWIWPCLTMLYGLEVLKPAASSREYNSFFLDTGGFKEQK
jgi:hypothetical protein